MDHHIVADVDTHMADAGGIIGSGEKHQIARFDVGRGYGRTDIAKSLRTQPAHIPTGMIDDPTDEARTVKRGGGAAAAPDRKSTRLNSSHSGQSRMPSSA